MRDEPQQMTTQVGVFEASHLRTLNSFAVDLISIPNAEDLLWYVAQNVVGRLKFIDCVIYARDEASDTLQQVAALGEKNPFDRSIINPLKIPVGRGITGQVAQTGKPIIVNDLLKDQNYIPDTQPARSEICVPLFVRGKVVGVIDSENPAPNAFGDAEFEILTTVAAMTSAKLELLAEAEQSHQRYQELVASHNQLSQETTNRKAVEAKLFASRKLEAIGRLTGKFAHDFNNLLTVISGNLDILAQDMAAPFAGECLNDARKEAARGANLIRHMLAFSQKTILNNEMANLNDIARSTVALSGQSIPQSAEIRLTLSEKMAPVKVDIKQTEAVILNLIANACEALSNKGVISIRTEQLTHMWADNHNLATPLTPGPYCCLTVHDTGEGIPAEFAQQIFDPFFTTKDVGQGPGLGLSMVLGFMQQSGGTVSVNSDPDHGTTFRLYFPTFDTGTNDLLTLRR